MALTALGRNVAVSTFLVPLVLWYIGFFGWTPIFFLQTLALCIFFGAKFTPRRPDADMDPITAACMNKQSFLPNDAPTHLTMVLYFDKCPSQEVVTNEFARVISEYPRCVDVLPLF